MQKLNDLKWKNMIMLTAAGIINAIGNKRKKGAKA